MESRHQELRKKVLKDILGDGYASYDNFKKDPSLPKKKQHRKRVPLWIFLLHLLYQDDSSLVEWSCKRDFEFRIVDPDSVAQLWGSVKYKKNMTYEKLGRALRYYYGKDIIEKVPTQRYTYKFILSSKTTKYLFPNSEIKMERRDSLDSIGSTCSTATDESSSTDFDAYPLAESFKSLVDEIFNTCTVDDPDNMVHSSNMDPNQILHDSSSRCNSESMGIEVPPNIQSLPDLSHVPSLLKANASATGMPPPLLAVPHPCPQNESRIWLSPQNDFPVEDPEMMTVSYEDDLFQEWNALQDILYEEETLSGYSSCETNYNPELVTQSELDFSFLRSFLDH